MQWGVQEIAVCPEQLDAFIKSLGERASLWTSPAEGPGASPLASSGGEWGNFWLKSEESRK